VHNRTLGAMINDVAVCLADTGLHRGDVVGVVCCCEPERRRWSRARGWHSTLELAARVGDWWGLLVVSVAGAVLVDGVSSPGQRDMPCSI
jgi:hypothetical protein